MRENQRLEYEWLFRTSYSSVLRSTFLIVRDRGRAEEVCQDAFLRLLENWGTVSEFEHPEAWVRKVAVRMAIRQAQREQRRPLLERVGARSTVPATDTAFPDPDLATALAALTPMQRAAVVLYYYEDRPVDEIARALRVSSSTVKQHLLRARSRLAALLGEEVADDVR